VEAAATQRKALELFAEELRLAQEALRSITGEFSADDLLGEIFGRFCIGK
jgi:tRNA modification GTPase